jgi:hypothetical protein
MSEPTISVDTDAAAATAAEWREYADRVEQHGSRHHVGIDELGSALGPVYTEYVQAKTGEQAARRAAYHRVAERARAHADHLEGTRRILTSTDDDSALRIDSVLDG